MVSKSYSLTLRFASLVGPPSLTILVKKYLFLKNWLFFEKTEIIFFKIFENVDDVDDDDYDDDDVDVVDVVVDEEVVLVDVVCCFVVNKHGPELHALLYDRYDSLSPPPPDNMLEGWD